MRRKDMTLILNLLKFVGTFKNCRSLEESWNRLSEITVAEKQEDLQILPVCVLKKCSYHFFKEKTSHIKKES